MSRGVWQLRENARERVREITTEVREIYRTFPELRIGPTTSGRRRLPRRTSALAGESGSYPSSRVWVSRRR